MSTGPTQTADILIVGGGIAGAGAAFELAASASVILLERESQCGYHSTGRSAASFTENYGGTVIRRLAIASRTFLENPPPGFCAYPLLAPRGMITVAREDQLELLELELDRARVLVPSITRIDAAAALARVPILRPDYVAGAFIEPHSKELDVHGLHQGFLRGARTRGAHIVVNAAVQSIERRDRLWWVRTPGRDILHGDVDQRRGSMGRFGGGIGRGSALGIDPKTAHRIQRAGARRYGYPHLAHDQRRR